MILCDREIQALLAGGLVVIDHHPPVESLQSRWSSTSVDLTLDSVVLEWHPKTPPTGGGIPPVKPFSPGFNVQRMMEDPQYARKVPIDIATGYELHPAGFILGFTKEKVSIPHRSRVAARVEGKSSLARLGLGVHVTAPTIHAGFGAKQHGDPPIPIQLEIFNLGPWVIRLDTGMPICQLIFEEVREVPAAGYGGQFSSQQHFVA